jgi:hypothetical protein
VHAAREFELLPLWFYVIELVSEDTWLSEYSAGAEALQSFTRAVQTACGTLSASALQQVGSLWDSFGKEPPPPLQLPAMQLAGRAVLLYLNHALDAKARGTLRSPPAVDLSSTGANDALKSQTTALLKCLTMPNYAEGYGPFFTSMLEMSRQGGMLPLAVFKREVVATLLPMAPYLAGL